MSNHTKYIKLRIEDEKTKNEINHTKGQYLFVNIMGYDQFRQSFLTDSKNSPHRLNIEIPDEIDAYYSGDKEDVNSLVRNILLLSTVLMK